MNYNIKKINRKVKVAIKILFENDAYLLKKNVHERSISHKLAEYLQTLFPDLNIDCEYNKKGDAEKRYLRDHGPDGNVCSCLIYPDIIIHQRNNQKNNLLVIEIKKKTSPTKKNWDLEKLIYFTDPSFGYYYAYGLFIEFYANNTEYNLEWYKDGKKYNFIDDSV